MTRQIAIAVASVLSTLLVLELVARSLVINDPLSAGILMGVRLPPITIVPAQRMPASREKPFGRVSVDGRKITVGDLWGYFRDDDVLGYSPLENAVSVNGWWQNNNVGARSRRTTKPDISHGTERILVFGESYAVGSRVPQEDAWPQILESLDSRLDVVSMGVDGYSMGQAYARYLRFYKRLQHNRTIMMFVPGADLWRDINTIRDLATPWEMPEPMPRFILEDGTLHFIRSPYSRKKHVYTDNKTGLSNKMKQHLRMYDRYYFTQLYENKCIIGDLVLYKFLAAVVSQIQKVLLGQSLMDPSKEALQVTRAIFLAMQSDERKLGSSFILVILPTEGELDELKKAYFASRWMKMVEFICNGIVHCVDLSPHLLKVPQQNRDRGFDGGHYGPLMNRHIARAIHGILP